MTVRDVAVAILRLTTKVETGDSAECRLNSAPAAQVYFLFVSRNCGALARVKTTTSSPEVVLMSWCKLSTLIPVTSSTIASRTTRAVSISWVLS